MTVFRSCVLGADTRSRWSPSLPSRPRQLLLRCPTSCIPAVVGRTHSGASWSAHRAASGRARPRSATPGRRYGPDAAVRHHRPRPRPGLRIRPTRQLVVHATPLPNTLLASSTAVPDAGTLAPVPDQAPGPEFALPGAAPAPFQAAILSLTTPRCSSSHASSARDPSKPPAEIAIPRRTPSGIGLPQPSNEHS